MKPIGYYVSVPKDHPDNEILEKIEQEFGSTLDSFTKDTLAFALVYCAGCYLEIPMWNPVMDEEAVKLIAALDALTEETENVRLWRRKKLIAALDALTEETAFALVPFIHQVICGRGEPKK